MKSECDKLTKLLDEKNIEIEQNKKYINEREIKEEEYILKFIHKKSFIPYIKYIMMVKTLLLITQKKILIKWLISIQQ